MAFLPLYKKDEDLEIPNKIIKCIKCNRIILENDANYCSNCGHKIKKEKDG